MGTVSPISYKIYFELDTDKMKEMSNTLFAYLGLISGSLTETHAMVDDLQKTYQGFDALKFYELWEAKALCNWDYIGFTNDIKKYAGYFAYAANRYELFAENAVARAKTIFGK